MLNFYLASVVHHYAYLFYRFIDVCENFSRERQNCSVQATTRLFPFCVTSHWQAAYKLNIYHDDEDAHSNMKSQLLVLSTGWPSYELSSSKNLRCCNVLQ